MTKEEQWKREAEIKLDELDDRGFDFDNWSISDAYERGYCDSAESREKRIAELEEKISILLSCKKEYEDKCLAQKIQYIKELEKENAELKAQIEKMKQDLDSARENANRQEQWEIYSVLNDIYNDNFEVITSVSN